MMTAIRYFEQQQVGKSTGQSMTALNQRALALMVNVGRRTGLFDTMTHLPPATVAQIAEAAGLFEPPVREWLGAMVMAELVGYDPLWESYFLPAEHAAPLTGAAAPHSFAAVISPIPQLGLVEEGMVQLFRNGGVVSGNDSAALHAFMAEVAEPPTWPVNINGLLSLAPGLSRQLEEGIEVLELGCGQGKALLQLAATFPRSRFTGYEFAEEALLVARAEAERQALTNLHLATLDPAWLGERKRYELIFSLNPLYDGAPSNIVLTNIWQALKPEGCYLMQGLDRSSRVEQNLGHPLGVLLYTLACLRCTHVSPAGGGAGVDARWDRETALTLLAAAGFTQTTVCTLPYDVQYCYYVSRKH
jgi:SAM-dependent methyltransferase